MQSIVVVVEYCCPQWFHFLLSKLPTTSPLSALSLSLLSASASSAYCWLPSSGSTYCEESNSLSPNYQPLLILPAINIIAAQTSSPSLSSFLSSYLNHHLSPPSPLGQIVQQKLDTTLLSEDKQKASLGKTNQSSYSCRLPQMGQRGKKQTTRIIQNHSSHQQHQHCHQYRHHQHRRPIICVS